LIAADNSEVRETLARVDWNFAARNAPGNTVHSLHWFPGNFIPQIPSYFVQLLSEPGDLVVDPFCGSGTTGVEALRLGRRTWLSDVNHASVQVTRGKIAAYLGSNVRRDLESIRGELVWDSLSRSTATGAYGEGGASELASWFDADTLAQLRYIWSLREVFRGSASEDLIEVVFADTLFSCASTGRARTSTGGQRRHHWGWIADNVVPKPPVWHNAIKVFRDKITHAITVLDFDPQQIKDQSVQVRREDARFLSLGDDCADLVVSSPPYVGMIDYTRANRLTYLWMNWPFDQDRTAEIGARYRRDNVGLLHDYETDMRAVAAQLARVTKPGGYCAIVIGSSRKFPNGSGLVLSLLAERLSMVWGPESRTPSRRRVAERQGTEVPEWLCVFRKSF